MKKLDLIIMDEDYAYGSALGEYITNHSTIFYVKVYSDIQTLKKELKEEIGVDIILLSENMIEHLGEVTDCLKIILLENNKMIDITPCAVDKYLSADRVVEEIKLIYGQTTGKEIPKNHESTKLLGFFSPSGGTGKTVASIAVARYLSSSHKKVLYLNFEDIPSTNAFFLLEDRRKNLSDFLYYFFTKEEMNLASLIKGFVSKDRWQVDFFNPQKNYNDLLQLSADEVKHLLDSFCQSSDYDYICVDLSCSLSPINLLILTMCYKRFNIINDNLTSRHKLNMLNDFCNSSEGAEFLDSSTLVINQCQSKVKDDSEFTIDDDPMSFRYENGLCQIALDGKFGKGIYRIVEYILLET